DRGGLRMSEDDTRYCAVVRFAALAEDVGGGDPAVVLAHVGERPDPGHVTDRPHALAGVHPRVDRYAVCVGLDADVLQTEIRSTRPAAGRHEQPLGNQLLAVPETDSVVSPVVRDAACTGAEMDPQSLTAEPVGQRLAERTRLTRQDVVHAFHEVHTRAEARERLRHLHSHGSAAEDHDAGRKLPYAGGFTIGPHALELRQTR